MNGENNEGRWSRIFHDLTLVFAIIFVGLFIFLLTKLGAERGNYVKITVDGGDPIYYSLAYTGEYSLNGGTNILVVSDGMVSVKDADCPDKVCEHSGEISRVGERIVCLPNRVYIEIVAERGD